MLLFVVAATVLGLVIGSFLNVVVWRVPAGRVGQPAAEPLSGVRQPGAALRQHPGRQLAGAARSLPRLQGADQPALPAGGGRHRAALRAHRLVPRPELGAAGVPLPGRHRRRAVVDRPGRASAAEQDRAAVVPRRRCVAGARLGGHGGLDCVAARRDRWCGPVSLLLRAEVRLPQREWASGTSSWPASSGCPWAGWDGANWWSAPSSGFLLGGVVGGGLLAVKLATRKSRIPFGPFMIVGAYLAVLVRRAHRRSLPEHVRQLGRPRPHCRPLAVASATLVARATRSA